MNVSLTRKLEALVVEKVKSGMYHSASEVIREGLRLLEERDELKRHRLRALRRDIAVGMEQADRGESRPLDMQSVIARVRKQAKTGSR